MKEFLEKIKKQADYIVEKYGFVINYFNVSISNNVNIEFTFGINNKINVIDTSVRFHVPINFTDEMFEELLTIRTKYHNLF